MYFDFISFPLIVDDSLQVKYHNFRQLMQIGPFADCVNFFLAVFTGVPLNLLFLVVLFQTFLQAILFLHL